MNKQQKFDKIIKDIKDVKIQGARNIALKALDAYLLFPTEKTKKILRNLRPTEPMLFNVLEKLKEQSQEKIISHFGDAQNRINKFVFSLIKNNDVVFIHCHSTNVINALIYTKNKKKKFKVLNTETRPLYQGRKTSIELKEAGIEVTQYVDSAAKIAITKGKRNIQVNDVFLGADAITKKGVINKIGSGMFAEIAYDNKVPVYIIADSWKFTKNKIPIEQRKLTEIWDKAPKNIKIQNPAFEFIDKKYIKAIISELGILSYNEFLKKVNS
jgi:translation initiation factor 2B subunit (eIF-2B alpha/beta/delta family)